MRNVPLAIAILIIAVPAYTEVLTCLKSTAAKGMTDPVPPSEACSNEESFCKIQYTRSLKKWMIKYGCGSGTDCSKEGCTHAPGAEGDIGWTCCCKEANCNTKDYCDKNTKGQRYHLQCTQQGLKCHDDNKEKVGYDQPAPSLTQVADWSWMCRIEYFPDAKTIKYESVPESTCKETLNTCVDKHNNGKWICCCDQQDGCNTKDYCDKKSGKDKNCTGKTAPDNTTTTPKSDDGGTTSRSGPLLRTTPTTAALLTALTLLAKLPDY